MVDLPAAANRNDVLSQPTRARLFALLGELRRSATTAELAERVELHPNGVRLHLERLEQAGLVRRGRARGERGRPPDGWTIAPGARPGGHPPSAYRELAPDHAAGTDALTAVLTSLGFAPAIERTAGGDGATLCLCNCPYREAVRENQPAVQHLPPCG